MGERISEADLLAYVDGELPTDARITIEARLRDDPGSTSVLLEDLRLRDELRLFLAEEDWPAPPRTIALARELTRRLHRRNVRHRVRRALIAASLIAIGWFAHQELDLFVDQVAAAYPAPAYAEEAADAYGALQAKLATGHGLDPALLELPSARVGGSVPVPATPEGWRFLGSDLAPWDGGVALVAAYEAHGQVLTLFAAETDGFAVTAPQVALLHDLPTAFWQHGPFAYALIGAVPAEELLAIARAAARGPWPGGFDQPASTGGTHG